MTLWDKEKYKEEYIPSPWLLIKKDVATIYKDHQRFVTTVPKVKDGYKKGGAGITMYVDHQVKTDMVALKTSWGCKNWNTFCVYLLSFIEQVGKDED